jgi:glycosyltransferase involved in cell wall biosynthesis
MIFRDSYLPFSENFIVKHSAALSRFKPSLFCRTQLITTPQHFPAPDFVVDEILGEAESQKLKFLRKSTLLLSTLKSFDAVLAHHCQDAWRISRIVEESKLPLLVMAHGSDVLKSDWSFPDHYGELALRGNWSRFARQVDRFIAVSDFVESGLLTRKIPRSKITRIYIGTEKSIQKPFADRTIDYLFVGRLTVEKGFLSFLDFIKKSRVDTKISIIGGGPLENELRNLLVEQNELASRVTFLGVRSGDDVKKFMSQSKFVVIPSIGNRNGVAEGLPMVAMEAFSAGTPVICTNLGGLSEVLSMGGSLRIDGNTEKPIQDVSSRLLHNEESWSNLSTLAHENWKLHFDISRNIKIFEEVVSEEIARKNRS